MHLRKGGNIDGDELLGTTVKIFLHYLVRIMLCSFIFMLIFAKL